MTGAGGEPTGPYRWDLVAPDQLGRLLEGTPEPDLWFLPELVRCAGKVLARCADGDLYFVGRSPDSMFDLLSGALSGTGWEGRPHRLPLSLWTEVDDLGPDQLAQFRTNLAHAGIEPAALARRRRPVVFVDLVSGGRTFRALYTLLDRWIDEVGAPRSVVRTKLRFVGITRRTKTSPNTWRWYQDADWAAALPRSALVGVSLHPHVWDYFGNNQAKTERSFHVKRWLDPEARVPAHDDRARAALAEAVAVVAAGRSAATRRDLVAVLTAEPAMREPWLRALVGRLGVRG